MGHDCLVSGSFCIIPIGGPMLCLSLAVHPASERDAPEISRNLTA